MGRIGFAAATKVFLSAGFRRLSIPTLVTLVIAWIPACEAGSEIRQDDLAFDINQKTARRSAVV